MSSLIVRYFTPRGNNTLNNGEDTAAWDRWKGSMTLDTRTARRGEPNRWLELGRCLASQEEIEAKPWHGEKVMSRWTGGCVCAVSSLLAWPDPLVNTNRYGAMPIDLGLFRFGVWPGREFVFRHLIFLTQY